MNECMYLMENPQDKKGHKTIYTCPRTALVVGPGSPPTGAPDAGGVGQNRRLSTNNRLHLENSKSKTHGFY